MQQRGFLFVNLGTPQSLSYFSLYSFLASFLSDWRVLDIPAIIRYPLVYGIIAPLRPWKIRRGYQKIWQGKSPLLQHSEALITALQQNTNVPIALGMTYQQPSMKQALKRLMDQGCRDIVVLPLFPQYASASTSASIAKVYELAATFRDPPALQIVPDFYNQAGYINAQASLIKRHLPESCDLLVFSFHGVPVRQLIKSGCQNAAACQSQACPERVAQCCYRAQCFETARAITKALKYEGEFTVAFQSRLGPIPWIKPYLDQSLTGWADRGIKNLVIVSASFTMDCLETLEEIHQEIKEQWLQLTQHQGQFTAVPCLNADPLWVETLGIWIKKMSNLDTAL